MSAGEDRLASALEKALKAPWAMYRNVAWLEKRPGDEPADGEADVVLSHPDLGVMVIEVKGGGVRRVGGRWESVDATGTAHQIKDPFAQVTRAMDRLKRVCGALPAWPSHDVRSTRAVCFPDAAYDRSMTPDGPREIVIDHDDLADVRVRMKQIFDWWSRSGDASADGGAPGDIGMKALHELLGRDLEIASRMSSCQRRSGGSGSSVSAVIASMLYLLTVARRRVARRASVIVMSSRSAAVTVIAAATVACASVLPSPSPSAEPPTLPGPMQELPDGAGEGASWTRADHRLPDAIDRDARYADELAAMMAIAEPFGDRPMPPNSPGITSSVLDGPPGEMRILVTYPTHVDERAWGEQFLIVLREGRDGWRLDQAWARALCTTAIDHESCA